MLDFQAKLAGQLSSALEHTHCARGEKGKAADNDVYSTAQCAAYAKAEKLARRKSASLDLESAPPVSPGGGSKLDAKMAQAKANAPQSSGDASSPVSSSSTCALPVCESLHCGSASTTSSSSSSTSSSSSASSAKADTAASLQAASKMLHEDSTQLVNTLHEHLKHHCLHNAMFDDQMLAMKHRIDKQFDQITEEDQRPPTPSSASTASTPASTPASRNFDTFLYVNRPGTHTHTHSHTLTHTHTHTRTHTHTYMHIHLSCTTAAGAACVFVLAWACTCKELWYGKCRKNSFFHHLSHRPPQPLPNLPPTSPKGTWRRCSGDLSRPPRAMRGPSPKEWPRSPTTRS